MATSSDDMKQAFTYRRYKDGDHKHHPFSEEIFQASWTHKCPTYIHRTPPCQGSCPSGHDVRGWLNIVRGIEKPTEGMSMEEYAFRRNAKANPFPAIMGRACPAPCEDGCNRNHLDDHVGINSVEQFIGDEALRQGYKFTAGADTGKKVAVIGGGPAGLSAAYQLRLKGHAVTIFEQKAALGGMLRYGLPNYRTPHDVVDGEVNRIINMGVTVKTGVKIGKDITTEQLAKDFDAVIFAMGAWAGRSLPVPGADAVNCITGIDFLAAFNEGRLKHVSGKVVVIGGGDTSIDVASVARRIGNITVENEKDRPESIIINQVAQDVAASATRQGAVVALISRSPLNKMAASQIEIEDASREGVEMIGQLSPVEVIKGKDGRATALRVVKLEEDGKTPIEGSEFDIECELIVSAIGQSADLSGFEDYANDKNLISADKHFQVPGKPGFFVCGDVVRPHLLTTAIGQASIAVESIEHYLNNKDQVARPKVDVHHFSLMEKLMEAGLEVEHFSAADKEAIVKAEGYAKEIDRGVRGTSASNFAVHNYEDRSFAEIITHDELFLGYFNYTPRNKREYIAVGADEVLGHFKERMLGLDEKQAVNEADRCMSCGMCFECDNCVVYCPQTAVKRVAVKERTMGRYVYTDYSMCIGCHICADVCPTGYIQMGMGE